MKEYERLTERDKNGIAIYKQKCDADDFGENLYIQAQREEAVLNRLAELEDKLEQGTLIELPCKVGDIVYYVNRYKQTIEEYEVLEFTICHNYTVLVGIGNGMCLYANEIILTKAEAEAKLKELKGE